MPKLLNEKKYISIMGPTASGKSSLAMELAREFNGEIINCDSVQLYRGFNIGSAKPSQEEMQEIPHHLLDVFEPNEDCDARKFADLAEHAISDVISRNKLPIVVGGTGLYFRSLWKENFHDLPKSNELRVELEKVSTDELYNELKSIDPKRAEELHVNDRFRVMRAVEVCRLLGYPVSSLQQSQKSEKEQSLVIKLEADRDWLKKRIRLRVKQMLEEGLVEEVKELLENGAKVDCKPMQSIGYKEVIEWNKNTDNSFDRLCEMINISTRQYAKKQATFFRKVDADLVWNRPNQSSDLIMGKMRTNYLSL